MRNPSRRDFLAASALAAGGLAWRDGRRRGGTPKAVGPNEQIVLGFIGVGGMGSGLLNIFKKMPDVRVARRLRRLRAAPPPGEARRPAASPTMYNDFREVLDRKDIDAVVDRHARPLARDPDHPGLPGRQGRLLREAARVPDRRGAGDGRRGREAQARHADGQPDPRRRELPPRRRDRPLGRARARSPRRASGWPPTARPRQARRRRPARRARLRLLARPRPEAAVQPEPLHVQLAVLLGLRRRHPDGLLLPHRRPRPLGDGGRRPRDRSPPPAAGTPSTTTPRRPTPSKSSTTTPKGFDMVWSQTDASSPRLRGQGAGHHVPGDRRRPWSPTTTRFEIFPEKGQDDRACPPPSLPRSVGPPSRVARRDQDAGASARATSSTAIGSSTVGHLGNIALWTGEKLRWDAKAERITNHADGEPATWPAPNIGPPGRCRRS